MQALYKDEAALKAAVLRGYPTLKSAKVREYQTNFLGENDVGPAA